jgi:hypothetical protein
LTQPCVRVRQRIPRLVPRGDQEADAEHPVRHWLGEPRPYGSAHVTAERRVFSLIFCVTELGDFVPAVAGWERGNAGLVTRARPGPFPAALRPGTDM